MTPSVDRTPPRTARPRRGEDELQRHIAGTYFGLRAGLALVGLLLPVVLVGGGLLLEGVGVQPSISDYYHTPLRDVFVGALFAIAGLLVTYRGFSGAEDRAFDLAAVFAVATALVPVGEGLHPPVAIGFFFCIAYVCLFRAADTLSLVKDDDARRRYRRTYQTLGLLMVLLPATAAVLGLLLFRSRLLLIVEVAAIGAFGAYWVAKSAEFARTHADRKAARGELAVAAPAEAEPAAPPSRVRRAMGGAFAQRAVVEVER